MKKISHVEVSRNGQTWKMHKALIQNLDLINHYSLEDWDFKELISGDGMTRTGKTTIAVQAAAYQDETFIPNWRERVIFDGEKLIDIAYKIGKNKALIYDEAREGLDSKKQMEKYTKNLLDFFSQCGNLNHKILIVLPEFFELPKSIAITQSVFLINCYARDGFQRGYFEFYNRKDKRYLYIKGTKFLDYKSQMPSFKGTFTKYFPIPRQEYEELKNKTMNLIRKRESYTKIKEREQTHKLRVKLLINYMMQQLKIKGDIISEIIGIGRSAIYNVYLKEKEK